MTPQNSSHYGKPAMQIMISIISKDYVTLHWYRLLPSVALVVRVQMDWNVKKKKKTAWSKTAWVKTNNRDSHPWIYERPSK